MPFVPTTKAELQAAVNTWCSGDITANPNIGQWNVTAITDMSSLL